MLPRKFSKYNVFDEHSRELIGSLILEGEKKSGKIL